MMRKWFEELQLRQYTKWQITLHDFYQIKKIRQVHSFFPTKHGRSNKNMHFLLNNSRMFNPKLSTTLNKKISGQIVISIRRLISFVYSMHIEVKVMHIKELRLYKWLLHIFYSIIFLFTFLVSKTKIFTKFLLNYVGLFVGCITCKFCVCIQFNLKTESIKARRNSNCGIV